MSQIVPAYHKVMKCLECGRDLKQISYLHLKYCCGLTPQQYREKRPGTEFADPEVRKSFGLPMERNPNWRGGRCYRKCKEYGKQLAQTNKSDLSVSGKQTSRTT